jgi:hypothetical protein
MAWIPFEWLKVVPVCSPDRHHSADLALALPAFGSERGLRVPSDID